MPPESCVPYHTLIIEDNRDLARLFSDLLEVLGCTADVAWNAQAGIAHATQRKPDVVFCDLNLPGDKDGFSVARTLRAHPMLSDVLLIAVTGFDTAWILKNARAAGFDDVFSKPVKFAQVQAVLTNLKRDRGNDIRLAPRTASDAYLACKSSDTSPL
jgi:CheY-like chemotaxis protein